MLLLMKRIWKRWKAFAHRLIQGQNWLLMAIVYWVAVAPVAIALKVVRHRVVPATPEPDAEGSLWQKRANPSMTMDRAGRMY